MIKTLQKKFILVAMIAVSILLVVLLGAINAVNIIIVNQQTHSTIHFLAQNNFAPKENEKNFLQIPRDAVPRNPDKPRLFQKPMNEDTFMSSRCFRVYLDSNNTVLFTDVSQISSINEEDASAIAYNMIQSGRFSGRTDSFRFDTIIYDVASPISAEYDSVMVFLDVSEQTRGIVLVLVLSFGLGIVAWALMFLLVVVLSKGAIKPIAENMQQQKRFITDAGHEIKTPLAIIRVNVDALELHNGKSKWSENIKNQTVRLNGLMQNMLTLSRMDEGVDNKEKVQVDVVALLNNVVDSFSEFAETEGKSIIVSAKESVSVFCVKENLCRTLNILVDNAVKYSASDTVITAEVLKCGSGCRLVIANRCSQMPDVEPQKLFERFYRGDAARTQSSGGYGIGLSVARSFADSMGGSLVARYLGDDTIEFVLTL